MLLETDHKRTSVITVANEDGSSQTPVHRSEAGGDYEIVGQEIDDQKLSSTTLKKRTCFNFLRSKNVLLLLSAKCHQTYVIIKH